MKKTTKPKRSYNNSSRKQKSQDTQRQILDAFVDLLVERRGGEVKIDEIAKRCQISERTVFRFFGDKEALYAATQEHLASYLRTSYEKLGQGDFKDFVRYVYGAFDEYPNVVMAYIYSPYGREARLMFRKEFVKMLVAHLRKSIKAPSTPQLEAKLAVMTSLVNANIWCDVLNDHGLSGKESGEVVCWMIDNLVEAINKDAAP